MAFTWSPETGRYRNTETGKLVSGAAVRDAVDLIADDASEKLRKLAERLRNEELTVAAWQRESMKAIKESQVAAAIAAHGGREQMTASDWGWVGSQVKAQYKYHRDFGAEVADGVIEEIGTRIAARNEMYGQAARVTFEAMRERDDRVRGYTEERSVIHSGKPCTMCAAEAAKGYVTIGEIVPIGSRTCLSRCRCTIERRAPSSATTRSHLRRVV